MCPEFIMTTLQSLIAGSNQIAVHSTLITAGEKETTSFAYQLSIIFISNRPSRTDVVLPLVSKSNVLDKQASSFVPKIDQGSYEK